MIKLYNADCFDIMPMIENKSVDAIIADLPYNTTNCHWDKLIPFEPMWEQLNRIIKPNGAIVLFGSEPFSSALRMSNIKHYKYDLYWKKEKPTNFFQLKKRFGKNTENIMIFYSKQPTYNPQKYIVDYRVSNKPKGNHKSIITGVNKKVLPYKDDGTRYPNDILEVRRVPLGKAVHETQKPVELIDILIKSFTNENDIILDFTMGSGTTGISAFKNNRQFIGIEKEEKYYEIAVKRIQEAGGNVIQQRLYDAYAQSPDGDCV